MALKYKSQCDLGWKTSSNYLLRNTFVSSLVQLVMKVRFSTTLLLLSESWLRETEVGYIWFTAPLRYLSDHRELNIGIKCTGVHLSSTVTLLNCMLLYQCWPLF